MSLSQMMMTRVFGLTPIWRMTLPCGVVGRSHRCTARPGPVLSRRGNGPAHSEAPTCCLLISQKK